MIKIDKFFGEIPRLPTDRLPVGAAQLAKNINTSHEELRTLKGLGTASLAHASARPVRGLFTDNGLRFFCWDKPTRAFLAPTIDDTASRVYYQSHGQGLRVTTTGDMRVSSLEPRAPTVSWKVGVRPPTGSLVLTRDGALPTLDRETVAVVATIQNVWGEESHPSRPMLLEKGLTQGFTMTLSHVPDAEQREIAGVNFYRTYAGNNTEYLLINSTAAPIVDGEATIYDNTTAAPTTTNLTSSEWDQPPAAAGNLTYVGNGFFVVSAGKDLVFSEPYRPHAWPYRMTFPHGVVGAVAIEGGILVTTQAQTYLVSGASPSQMGQQLLPTEQAGWSDTSMTRVAGSAIYASNDGLVDVFGGQPSIDASQQLFTRKDWRSRYGNARLNLRLAQHDGYILGIVDPDYPIAGSTEPSFLLRLDEANGAFCTLDLPGVIYSASVSGTTDQLYVGTSEGFAEFAASNTRLEGDWWSGDFLHPAPKCYGAAIVDCTGTFDVRIYAGGTLIHTQAVTNRTQFRLPSAAPNLRWSIRFTGTGSVRSFEMGSSFAELKEV